MFLSAYPRACLKAVSVLMGVSMGLWACGDDGECAPGTTEQGGFCRPVQDSDDDQGASGVRCGDGTVLEDGQCLPEQSPLRCGDGTMEIDGQCVAVDDESDERISERDAESIDSPDTADAAERSMQDVFVDIQEPADLAEDVALEEVGPDGLDALETGEIARVLDATDALDTQEVVVDVELEDSSAETQNSTTDAGSTDEPETEVIGESIPGDASSQEDTDL